MKTTPWILILAATLLCACTDDDGRGEQSVATPDATGDVTPDATGDATPDATPDVDPSEDTDANPASTPPLYITVTVHLEGWSELEDRERFDAYIGRIRGYSDLFLARGARFSWEAANLIEPSQMHGVNILKELEDAGHSVAVHADLGGNISGPGGPYTQTQFVQDLIALREGMADLGIEARGVSGICSELDWVTAAIDAGFEYSSAQVELCLKSLPFEAQPPNVQSCTNPAQCHDPYPSTTDERLHPWRVRDGASWTTPDPTGQLVTFHSFGTLNCAHESLDPDSPTGCEYDADDVDTSIASIEEALAQRDPDGFNTYVAIWSFGGPLDEALLAEWLERIQPHVDSGEIVWSTLPEMHQRFEAWEASR